MALMLHIVIALTSVGSATFLFFQPSKTKLRVTYSLVGATLATGSYLIVVNPAHMVQACMSGLIYIGAVSAAVIAARHKLALLPEG